MRISYWSSDVGSYDLDDEHITLAPTHGPLHFVLGDTGVYALRRASAGSLSVGYVARYASRVAATYVSRSEERRGGKECVSPCSSRWPPHHQKQKIKQLTPDIETDKT